MTVTKIEKLLMNQSSTAEDILIDVDYEYQKMIKGVITQGNDSLTIDSLKKTVNDALKRTPPPTWIWTDPGTNVSGKIGTDKFAEDPIASSPEERMVLDDQAFERVLDSFT